MIREIQPYIGVRSFQEEEKSLFWGREREAEEALSLIIVNRTSLIYAQSGAGKTSFVNARLIPGLRQEGFEVLPVARVAGLVPAGIDARNIANLYVFNSLVSLSDFEADPGQLTQVTFARFLAGRAHSTDNIGLPVPRAIIFDQFEELLTQYPDRWRERKQFFEQIRDTLEADPLLRIVFVMREEYLAQLDPFSSALPDRLRAHLRLEPLRELDALQAVVEPLKATGRSFAPGVAERLIEQLLMIHIENDSGELTEEKGEFVEPVQLQVVCHSLWQMLPRDATVIGEEHIEKFGDVTDPLSKFYEQAIFQTVSATGVSETNLRRWFTDQLITPAGTRGIVFRGQKNSGGMPNAAVDLLVDQHLLRGERRAGALWYELTHDRLIDGIQTSNQAWRNAQQPNLDQVLEQPRLKNDTTIESQAATIRRLRWLTIILFITTVLAAIGTLWAWMQAPR
jgi:hypothetical protein